VSLGDLATDDCNDADNTMYPGAAEICNGIADGCGGTPDVGTMVSQAECQALLTLFTGTNGTNWTSKTGWLTAYDIDSWHGLNVTGGHVTHINLQNNLLSGVLYTNINQLDYTTGLNLSVNNLQGITTD